MELLHQLKQSGGMDKLAAMRAFVRIVDDGSLSAAAVTLGRSLPTMVRTLAALEASLGVVLLRRTTRRMSLTSEGRFYLDHCRRILGEVEAAEELVGRTHAEPRGPLRITAPVVFGQKHVVPAVLDFVRRYQAVQIELVLLDRVVDLVDEGIDAGVRIARLPDSSLIAVPIAHMRRVVCASPAFLRQHGEPAQPEDLATRPSINFQTLAPGGGWSFRRNGRDVVVAVRGPFVTNQAAAALDACTAGLGFGRFLAYQVAEAVAAKRLRVVLREFEIEPTPVSLVHPEARMVSPRLRLFLDALKKHLQARRIGALPDDPPPARRAKG
jgi:DNA-binding transcriptional LysR family regulator